MASSGLGDDTIILFASMSQIQFCCLGGVSPKHVISLKIKQLKRVPCMPWSTFLELVFAW